MKRASDHRRLPRAEPPPIIRLTGDQILKPQIERLVQNLLRVADEALASTHIVEKDRALLEQAKVNLKGVQPLVEMLSSTGDAADGATGLALLLHALSGAYRVGARATITASAVVYSKRLGAAHARRARAESPRQRALTAVIVAEARRLKSRKGPWKDAAAIKGRVNGWLRAEGHKPASTDEIYRRLAPK